MNLKRSSEIVSRINAFNKATYTKSEMYNELISLQNEVVKLTFEEEHSKRGNLRIGDVFNHFNNLNQQYNNLYDDRLARFRYNCEELDKAIRIETAGLKGENKVFLSLDNIAKPNVVLKNVELSYGGFHTEIDAMVIIPGRIILVEIKNTAKDIRIDENGEVINVFGKKTCNVVDKLVKDKIVIQNILSEEFNMDRFIIEPLVVFANSRVDVDNRYDGVNFCYSYELCSVLNNYERDDTKEEDITLIADFIRKHEQKRTYPAPFDTEEFKYDFADLMSCFEDISSVEGIKAFKSNNKKVKVESLDDRDKPQSIGGEQRRTVASIIAGVITTSLFVTKVLRKVL